MDYKEFIDRMRDAPFKATEPVLIPKDGWVKKSRQAPAEAKEDTPDPIDITSQELITMIEAVERRKRWRRRKESVRKWTQNPLGSHCHISDRNLAIASIVIGIAGIVIGLLTWLFPF